MLKQLLLHKQTGITLLNLSFINQGAYTPSHVYSRENISTILYEGRLRGIRILPEFDTPGHSWSWGQGYPGEYRTLTQGDKYCIIIVILSTTATDDDDDNKHDTTDTRLKSIIKKMLCLQQRSNIRSCLNFWSNI